MKNMLAVSQKLKKLNNESLVKIILEMMEFLPEEQCLKLELRIENCITEMSMSETEMPTMPERMSQEFVDEKMSQIETWMQQIDEGELYLDTDEYEDYSMGYWDSEWITNYFDNQGIGDKLMSMIQFAKDCVDDRRYQEAHSIYEWLWEMFVNTDSEYECDPVDLELLAEEKIVSADIEQLALMTLYADYQVQKPEKRAEGMYLYFSYYAFQKLHIEDVFRVGRENLTQTEQFWRDWIGLLKTKNGDVEGRLLREAVLYNEGVKGLAKMAEENCNTHPSLYLAAMKEYDKSHDYVQIENLGEKALERVDVNLKIRSEIALKAAYAASCLNHTDKVMIFCWESFCSDSTDRNFLRLFGMKEMAERYGMRGKEVLASRIKGNPPEYIRNAELRQNIMGDYGFYILSFYTGNFEMVKQISKNPQGSLGWSTSFIQYGIRLFLLYLYEKALPSKAAQSLSGNVGFPDVSDLSEMLDFESKMIEESRKYKISLFWNYFQRWKQYFPMEQEEKKRYLSWAEKIVYSRADAIVGGQHRRQYGEVAVLLAMVAEIKEDMGEQNAKQEIFALYKRKFPRHSSFQAEMKTYFGKCL